MELLQLAAGQCTRPGHDIQQPQEVRPHTKGVYKENKNETVEHFVYVLGLPMVPGL